MKGLLHHKLQDQDVASLKDIILERGQSVLDEIEGSHASVNRMYQRPQQQRSQYNRGYQTGAPPDRRPYQRQYQRSGGATRRYQTPSPTRAPKNPDNYCPLFLKDTQRKHEASTHFLRQCPELPQRERVHFANIRLHQQSHVLSLLSPSWNYSSALKGPITL